MAECRCTISAVADLQQQLRVAQYAVQRLTDERDQWRDAATKLDRARVKEYEEALGQRPVILKSGKHSPEFYERLWD